MFDHLTLILSITLLIILSAFFSSSETALTAASDARMRQLARNGSKNAKLVEKLRSDREELIGAILIGNNAVNVLASAVATSAAITLVGDNGVFIATLVMTILLILFAEVLPKTYAFNHANQYALLVATPVRIVVLLFRPLSIALRWIVVIFLGSAREQQEDREEELRGMIELHSDNADSEQREKKAMLSSVLDLSELTVDEIMTHRGSVSMVNVNDKPEDIVSFVLNSPHTRLPIFSGKPENIIGVLHVKDLLRGLQNSNPETLEEFDIAKIASPTYFIPETTLLASQLQAFRTRREHFAIVVDEYGDFRGIVTLEDIIEEIVGDIDDEHDEELAGCIAQADGSYVVDGNVTIRDLNRILDLTLPDDDASTLAGLLLYETRTIPLPGQEFKINGMRFRVVHKENNQITSLRIWTKLKNTSTKTSSSRVTE